MKKEKLRNQRIKDLSTCSVEVIMMELKEWEEEIEELNKKKSDAQEKVNLWRDVLNFKATKKFV